MKPIIKILLTAIVLISFFSASARTILTPQAEKDYNQRLELQPQIKDRLALTPGLSENEKDALTFLYAYLPTSDILDYDADFFLENARIALKASEEMPWGKSVPDREWRHFVLPVRVNNEDLDLSRKIFYEELKPRLKGLTMEEAILEVNHWCHEKVSYQPSDPRTSSPLATVANALGRCGEESTFTVAALRSVGIPARQVYTPRWAHTDDNHAWVEAWADGKWYFLGACEPEAVLNLAWFNAPAARGMLMTTKVSGAYDGPEELLEKTPISTVINVTENYAPVAQSSVYVIDPAGNPVKNAKVRFCIYNYAEFYPVVEKLTNEDGMTQFTSGLGDLIVWASDGKCFNLSKVKAGETLRLILDKDSSFTGSIDFDLTPPPSGGSTPYVSNEAAALNDRRKAYEDSLRNAYVKTFPNESAALELCRQLGLNDSYVPLIVESRANYPVIEKFLREASLRSNIRPTDILDVLGEKDLHDVSAEVLYDQIDFTQGDAASSLFKEYVLNPRVEFELLRPFKQSINEMLSSADKERYRKNPRLIEDFIRSGIITDTLYNPESCRQSAVATLRNRIADPLNKAIAFVSVCRALGIPSRYDPVSAKAQYADASGVWQDVTLTEISENAEPGLSKSILYIDNRSDLKGRTPKYYSQFTVSRMTDGLPQLMEFDDFEPIEEINNRHEPIAPGQYFLLSGQRLADGTVLARGEFFRAEKGETASATLAMRQDNEALQVIGSLNAELIYTPVEFKSGNMVEGEPKSILSSTGRGYYVLGIILPAHEPSAHALNDIAAAADEIAATGRQLLLLFPDKDAASRFNPEDYGKLPANVIFGIDDGTIADELKEGLELKESVSTDLPIIVVADSFNRIIFSSQGYAIRLEETLARILNSVSN